MVPDKISFFATNIPYLLLQQYFRVLNKYKSTKSFVANENPQKIEFIYRF